MLDYAAKLTRNPAQVTPDDLELSSAALQCEHWTLKEFRETLEKDVIQRELAKHHGNVTKTAAKLGISRPTLHELLDRYQIPASFFIPAVSAIVHPEMIPAILKSGRHEIGVHGWIHESLPPLEEYEEERLRLRQSRFLGLEVQRGTSAGPVAELRSADRKISKSLPPL